MSAPRAARRGRRGPPRGTRRGRRGQKPIEPTLHVMRRMATCASRVGLAQERDDRRRGSTRVCEKGTQQRVRVVRYEHDSVPTTPCRCRDRAVTWGTPCAAARRTPRDRQDDDRVTLREVTHPTRLGSGGGRTGLTLMRPSAGLRSQSSSTNGRSYRASQRSSARWTQDRIQVASSSPARCAETSSELWPGTDA